MHRCFVDPADWNESEMRLPAPEEHHLLHVLRAKNGDTVAVFDGRGREALARIVEGGGRRAVLKVLTGTRVVQRPVSLTLIQALPKGRKMDLIVEKATELGVSAIFPVISERVVARLNEHHKKKRGERWQRIALNAARQCGTGWVPEVKPVSGFGDAVRGCDAFDLFLVGSLGDDARPFHSVMDEVKARGQSSAAAAPKRRYGEPRRREVRVQKEREGGGGISRCGEGQRTWLRNIALLIGPEGDLAPAEIREALDMGAVPVSFGSLVLRVETAALYGLSVLAYEFLTGGGL